MKQEYLGLNHTRIQFIPMRKISITRLTFTLIFFYDRRIWATTAAFLQPNQRHHVGVPSKYFRPIELTRSIHLLSNKLDFIGSLENAYEINKTNNASSIFLRELVGESSSELLRRLMVETFEDVAPGTWRIVYKQDLSTSFGFGSFLSDVHLVETKLENNGEITCEIVHCSCCNLTEYSTHQISAVVCRRQYQIPQSVTSHIDD